MNKVGVKKVYLATGRKIGGFNSLFKSETCKNVKRTKVSKNERAIEDQLNTDDH
jgi:hypothetical protein